jgi:hypothetical protein
VHSDVPLGPKLWSPLRPPLTAFFARHPGALVAYFLDAPRLFSQRGEYYWLLCDLVLHPTGGASDPTFLSSSSCCCQHCKVVW